MLRSLRSRGRQIEGDGIGPVEKNRARHHGHARRRAGAAETGKPERDAEVVPHLVADADVEQSAAVDVLSRGPGRRLVVDREGVAGRQRIRRHLTAAVDVDKNLASERRLRGGRRGAGQQQSRDQHHQARRLLHQISSRGLEDENSRRSPRMRSDGNTDIARRYSRAPGFCATIPCNSNSRSHQIRFGYNAPHPGTPANPVEQLNGTKITGPSRYVRARRGSRRLQFEQAGDTGRADQHRRHVGPRRLDAESHTGIDAVAQLRSEADDAGGRR